MSNIDHTSIERQIAEWLETLDYLLEENIALKHRLSDIIVRNRHTKAGLEMLEAFQNSFINKDAHIALLRQDINVQGKLADALLTEHGTYHSFNHKQRKLQFEVVMMCEQFNRLKTVFESQLAIGAMA